MIAVSQNCDHAKSLWVIPRLAPMPPLIQTNIIACLVRIKKQKLWNVISHILFIRI